MIFSISLFFLNSITSGISGSFSTFIGDLIALSIQERILVSFLVTNEIASHLCPALPVLPIL
ncbi:MAG: hypothetical protein LBQ59_05780 [Candidatus Peribacteria bacterium]|nr:hypothetical protein [Candidatus Peribacteria bacterium]